MLSDVYSSIGHGGSDGLHAYVHSLDDAVSDLVSSGNTRILLNKYLNGSLGTTVKCCCHVTDVTGSSHGNSLLRNRVRLCAIDQLVGPRAKPEL